MHKALLVPVLLLAGAGLVFADAASLTPVQPDIFDRWKALEGTWEGAGKDGKPARITYTVTSAGSVVMETLTPSPEETMVTMYHRDGDRLMATHYCAAGNQPRMRSGKVAADAKTITFDYVDATNLAKPGDPHMVRLAVTFVDPDHVTQEWTFRSGGKDDTWTFSFARVK
jgi:hypothetical protein